MSTGTRVYVGNLGSDTPKEEIEREFSRFGRVKDVWIARNPPGFAFVEYDDKRDAEVGVFCRFCLRLDFFFWSFLFLHNLLFFGGAGAAI
jgi:hypothetical protein